MGESHNQRDILLKNIAPRKDWVLIKKPFPNRLLFSAFLLLSIVFVNEKCLAFL